MTDPADLLVWRHGRTEWNDTGRFQGQADPPLDDVGHAQGRAAAAALASVGPARIVSSDLRRAYDTAVYLGALTGLPVETDKRLREMDVGEWSGRTRDEIAAAFPESYAAWLNGEDVRREGGENYADVLARVSAALAELTEGPLPLVVVTHGGTARAVLMAMLALPSDAWAAFGAMGNARWAALQRRQSGWRLTGYNVGPDAGHAAPANADAPTEPVL